MLSCLKLLLGRALSWAVLFGQLLQRLEHLVRKHARRCRSRYDSGRGSRRWTRYRCLRGHHRHRSRRWPWRRCRPSFHRRRSRRRRWGRCRLSGCNGWRRSSLLAATGDEYSHRHDDEQQKLRDPTVREQLHGVRLQPSCLQLQRSRSVPSWVVPESEAGPDGIDSGSHEGTPAFTTPPVVPPASPAWQCRSRRRNQVGRRRSRGRRPLLRHRCGIVARDKDDCRGDNNQ